MFHLKIMAMEIKSWMVCFLKASLQNSLLWFQCCLRTTRFIWEFYSQAHDAYNIIQYKLLICCWRVQCWTRFLAWRRLASLLGSENLYVFGSPVPLEISEGMFWKSGAARSLRPPLHSAQNNGRSSNPVLQSAPRLPELPELRRAIWKIRDPFHPGQCQGPWVGPWHQLFKDDLPFFLPELEISHVFSTPPSQGQSYHGPSLGPRDSWNHDILKVVPPQL